SSWPPSPSPPSAGYRPAGEERERVTFSGPKRGERGQCAWRRQAEGLTPRARLNATLKANAAAAGHWNRPMPGTSR
ncbi:MAG TPA: hypothetical protein VE198_08565, partial [Actinoallomurus sp.]|nr:hypothetical protein [Actinoallomurus sp.]